MYKHVFLVDITEHQGLDESAFCSVQAYSAECEPVRVDWFKLPRQADPRSPIGGEVLSVTETGPQLWPTIRQRIAQLSSNGYSGSIFNVLSYNRFILAEARALNRPDLVVKTKPVPALITAWRTSTRNAQPPRELVNPVQYSAPSTLSPSDALQLAKSVLKQHGHVSQQTAMLQVKLRILMTQADKRAKKNPLDRNSSRLIPNLIAEGVRTRSIGQYNIDNIPGTERIWLIEGGDVSREVSTAPSPLLSESPSVRKLEGTLPAPPVGAVASSFTAATTAPTQLATLASEATLEGVGGAASSKQAESKENRSASDGKGRIRTSEIVAALKSAGVYSPPPQRNALLIALRKCLPEGCQPKMLQKLSREIRQEATGSHESESAKFKFWHPATEGTVHMLLGAGVLFDQSEIEVPDGPFVGSAEIARFTEPLELTCSAFLIETAINRLKNMNKLDKVAIAHAVLWDGPDCDRDKMMDEFEQAFRLLEYRFVESPDGVWHIEPRPKKARAAGAS